MSESKVILVTGANRGIGFEVCRQLSGQGHQLILGSRNLEKGRQAARKLPVAVTLAKLDLNDTDTFGHIVKTIHDTFGRLDVLVNNAGITGRSSGFDRTPIEEIKKIAETNLYGPVELTRQLLPLLKKSASGRVINVSSGMGAVNNSGSGYAAYRLSKAALNAFSSFLAADVFGTDITVNAVCPGWVRTEMGGTAASRSVKKGAETIVWLATEKKVPNGKFLRDKKIIDW